MSFHRYCGGVVLRRAITFRNPPRTGVVIRLASSLASPDPTLIDASRVDPLLFDKDSVTVYRDFIEPEQSDAIMAVLEGKLKRRRYERGHWDAVIVKYKEIELPDEDLFASDLCRHAVDKVRHQLLEQHFRLPSVNWLPCHAIDLHAEGQLQAHVDSVRFSGDVVAGLSLLSGSIMRFRPSNDNIGDDDKYKSKQKQVGDLEEQNQNYIDLYLPPLSLYVMSGTARYNYTHELLPDGAVFAGTTVVSRGRRISIIFRDAKDAVVAKKPKVSRI